jgi:hypothetical protein
MTGETGKYLQIIHLKVEGRTTKLTEVVVDHSHKTWL